MSEMKLLAAALLVFGASTAANAQETATHADKGEYLARAGDCIACHSVRGGKAFAGGLRMGTPMGVIYSTNITPDPDTGIGNYSLRDFDRALRSGIAKDGHHLYPAMPYPSYAKITDEDVEALYSFFMKDVPAVKQANKPNEIPWYRRPRWPLAVWNTIFARASAYMARPDRDGAWNRGAYLVEGLGHCGACHTPRGWAFQEKALDDSSGTYLQGAELDAWSAPNLRSDLRTGLGAWSLDDIVALLKSGHNDKGVAFGSMLDVVNNSTPYLSDEDTAMAACSPHRLTCASARATLRPLSICESKRGAMASPATLGDDGNCLAAGGCGICLG
jgi:alcohol dehydrogenase (quinone), cytochrome c subunit